MLERSTLCLSVVLGANSVGRSVEGEPLEGRLMAQQRDRSTEDDNIAGTSVPGLPLDDVENAQAEGSAQDLVGGDDEVNLDGVYDEDTLPDPAYAAVIEAGGGVSEGFEQSEAALVSNATNSEGSTRDILLDAIDEDGEGAGEDSYGEGDDVREADIDR